jgi:23S rRNA pseudouridine1911/1915/1917 synthase
MGIVPLGKSAKTMFRKLLASKDETSELIVCKLFTGRTHQIRVHLESLSRHILGDHLYGTNHKDSKVEHILLHAYRLYLIHPTTKESLSFQASMDVVMKNYCEKHFESKEYYETFAHLHLESLFSA